MFDIDYLTDSMNYIPVSLENQANPNAGSSKDTNSAGTTNEEEESSEHIIIPTTVQLSTGTNGIKKSFSQAKVPSVEEQVKETSPQNDDTQDLRKEADSHLDTAPEITTTSTNFVNTGSESEKLDFTSQADLNKPVIPEPTISDVPDEGLFTEASYDEEGVITEFNNLPTEVDVSPVPTLRIHNVHPQSQILGNPKSAVQTRRQVQQQLGSHALISFIQKQQRNNYKDQQHCLFACFLSQKEPTKVSDALDDESWVEAMQEELLQFKLQKVWVLVDLPHGSKVIGTKWVFRNKIDERGVVVRNKARLVV